VLPLRNSYSAEFRNFITVADNITPEQLEDGLQYHRHYGISLGESLVVLGHINQFTLLKGMSLQTGVPCLSQEIDSYIESADQDVLDTVAFSRLLELKAVPVRIDREENRRTLTILTALPFNDAA
jgi:hypothetical protein